MRRTDVALRFFRDEDQKKIARGEIFATLRSERAGIEVGDTVILCCPFTGFCLQSEIVSVVYGIEEDGVITRHGSLNVDYNALGCESSEEAIERALGIYRDLESRGLLEVGRSREPLMYVEWDSAKLLGGLPAIEKEEC